jgi:hypothetical protein
MGGAVILPPMVTLSSAPRFTTATLASATAGPFNIGFRVFATSTTTAKDALEVLVNGAVRTDFTVAGDFSTGRSDTATITFTAPLAIADVVDIYGNLEPERQEDLIGTGLVRLLNMELPRLWTSVADMLIKAKSAVRLAGGVAAPPITYDDGKVLIMQDSMIKAGPSADEITNAQANAVAAAASAGAAQTAVVAATGVAAGFGLQTIAGRITLGGTANALTINTGLNVGAVLAGQRIRVLTALANTGAVTLQIDALPAVAVLSPGGVALTTNYWTAAQELELTYDGTAWRAALPVFPGRIGPLATTSGTQVELAGIPPRATEIDVILDGVSGTHPFSNDFQIRLGTSASVETSGYFGLSAVNGTTGATVTASFKVPVVSPSDVVYGVLSLKRPDASQNVWVASGSILYSGGLIVITAAKTLAAELTRVQISSANGNFDAGRITVTYR